MRLLRVGLVVAVFAVGLGFWMMHSAKAQLHDRLLSLGPEMLLHPDDVEAGGVREMRINGRRAFVLGGSIDKDLVTVLDGVRAACRSKSQDLPAAIAGATPQAASAEVDDGSIMHHIVDGEGFVACLVKEDGDPRTLWERLEVFGRTSDLGDLGAFRYVYAREWGDSTTFAAVWTEGSFRLAGMFPAEGDAPGVDARVLPRPRGSIRRLSTEDVASGRRMVIYDRAHGSPAQLAGHYRGALERRGYGVTRAKQNEDRPGTEVMMAERGPDYVYLVLGTGEAGDGVTIIESLRRAAGRGATPAGPAPSHPRFDSAHSNGEHDPRRDGPPGSRAGAEQGEGTR